MFKKNMTNVLKIIFAMSMCLTLAGCSNYSTTVWGGKKTIHLPEGMKFINYNIQDSDNIWCTYRPMRDDEIAETYIVQQNKGGLMSVMGDGQFIIYETKDGVQSPDIEGTEKSEKESQY